jgi:hypothetical protein
MAIPTVTPRGETEEERRERQRRNANDMLKKMGLSPLESVVQPLPSPTPRPIVPPPTRPIAQPTPRPIVQPTPAEVSPDQNMLERMLSTFREDMAREATKRSQGFTGELGRGLFHAGKKLVYASTAPGSILGAVLPEAVISRLPGGDRATPEELRAAGRISDPQGEGAEQFARYLALKRRGKIQPLLPAQSLSGKLGRMGASFLTGGYSDPALTRRELLDPLTSAVMGIPAVGAVGRLAPGLGGAIRGSRAGQAVEQTGQRVLNRAQQAAQARRTAPIAPPPSPAARIGAPEVGQTAPVRPRVAAPPTSPAATIGRGGEPVLAPQPPPRRITRGRGLQPAPEPVIPEPVPVAPPANTPITTPAQMPTEEADDIVKWFADFIESPQSVEASSLTQQWRTAARAGRAQNFQARLKQLTDQGMAPEAAISRARQETMAGRLPQANISLQDVASPEIRDALFATVYKKLEKEPFELMSTVEALTNALLGKAIPRIVGTAGRSAFTRLQRVFPPEIVTALDKQLTIQETIGLAKAPRGVTKRLADIPDNPLTTQARLMEAETAFQPRRIARDPRTVAERDLDLQEFATTFGESPQQLSRPLAKLPPLTALEEVTIQQPALLLAKDKTVVRSILEEAGWTTVDIGNFLRANMASTDISWPRQMAFLIFGNPREFGTGIRQSFKAAWSQKYADDIMAAIRKDPLHKLYEEIGGDFLRPLDAKGFRQWKQLADLTEEFQILGGDRFLPRLANKLPWIRISARAHVTGINTMSWQIFKRHYANSLKLQEMIGKGGVSAAPSSQAVRWARGVGGIFNEGLAVRSEARRIASKPGAAFSMEGSLRDISKMLADMSGRGPLTGKIFGKTVNVREFTPAINSGLFSARLLIGRFISPRHLWSPNILVRQAAWRNFITAVTGFSSILFAGERMGLWELELDPRSADFMKARVGPIRVDIWGGYQQYATLYGRLLMSLFQFDNLKSTTTGQISEAGPETLAGRFILNKKSPLLSNIFEAWTGKDFKGSEIDRADGLRWLKRNAPLAGVDIFEAFQAEGISGVGAGATALFGGGVLVYDLPRWPEIDQYYELETTKERNTWRRNNPEHEAKLFIRGQITVMQSRDGIFFVAQLMQEHNINPKDIKGLNEVSESMRRKVRVLFELLGTPQGNILQTTGTPNQQPVPSITWGG